MPVQTIQQNVSGNGPEFVVQLISTIAVTSKVVGIENFHVFLVFGVGVSGAFRATRGLIMQACVRFWVGIAASVHMIRFFHNTWVDDIKMRSSSGWRFD